jgi:methionyl-tRNA formyltransferase
VRIVFWGTPEPAVPALRAFLDAPDAEVVAVVANPDRPRGRGHRLEPPPTKVAAAQAGVAVLQPERPSEILARLRGLRPDACAVVAYGALLPQPVLDAGGAGFVNLHFSLLPAWRGAAPVPHALLGGDAVTGVTCFVLEAGMDTGPVLLSAETAVREDETAGELTARLAELGAPLLVESVRGLVDGTIAGEPQDHERATYAPKISPADAAIDWSASAEEIRRVVRAFNPVPGAHTRFRDDRLKVHRADLAPADGEPGLVVEAGPGGPVVACGRGGLRLAEVQPAGKPRMSGAAFVNGYRPLGVRLGR